MPVCSSNSWSGYAAELFRNGAPVDTSRHLAAARVQGHRCLPYVQVIFLEHNESLVQQWMRFFPAALVLNLASVLAHLNRATCKQATCHGNVAQTTSTT